MVVLFDTLRVLKPGVYSGSSLYWRPGVYLNTGLITCIKQNHHVLQVFSNQYGSPCKSDWNLTHDD